MKKRLIAIQSVIFTLGAAIVPMGSGCRAGTIPMTHPRVYYIDPTGADTKDPSVVRFGGRYLMYYSLHQPARKQWTIGIATSRNLLDWSFTGVLAQARPPLAVEIHGYCAPGARVIDGKVHLFYQSYGPSPHDAILHAVSDDGLHFTRTSSTPVFRPTGDWTNGRAIDAEVHVFNNQLVLFWATRDRAHGATQMVGVSTAALNGNDDFNAASWTQKTVQLLQAFRPTVPLPNDPPGLNIGWEQQCIEGPTLLKHGGHYYLFYGGAFNNKPQQIGVAVADDPTDMTHFRRMNDGRPILVPGPMGAWNAGESGHPGAFKDDDGRDYLFYQGDNPSMGIKWHLSMLPLRWQPDPAGGPDRPVPDAGLLHSMK